MDDPAVYLITAHLEIAIAFGFIYHPIAIYIPILPSCVLYYLTTIDEILPDWELCYLCLQYVTYCGESVFSFFISHIISGLSYLLLFWNASSSSWESTSLLHSITLMNSQLEKILGRISEFQKIKLLCFRKMQETHQ